VVIKFSPKLSILISVYGQADKLKRCLSSLQNTLPGNLPYEVLIIDDASEDHTTEFIKSYEASYRVFLNKKRSGFAKNNNFLARQARGEYLCLLNSDAFVQGNWFFPMFEVFQKEQNVGMVGNVQKLADSMIYDHAGVVFGPAGNPRHFGQGFLFNPMGGGRRRWSAVTAACTLVKRETFLSFDGFDEDFINGCEDVELCVRMSRSGFEHYVAHNSVIQHVKGASDGRKIHNRRNFEILMQKWGKSIRATESVRDQKLHAITYLYLCLINPYRITFFKLAEAIGILLGLKKLPPPAAVTLGKSSSVIQSTT